MSLIFL